MKKLSNRIKEKVASVFNIKMEDFNSKKEQDR